jgi:hypothetical protein
MDSRPSSPLSRTEFEEAKARLMEAQTAALRLRHSLTAYSPKHLIEHADALIANIAKQKEILDKMEESYKGLTTMGVGTRSLSIGGRRNRKNRKQRKQTKRRRSTRKN